MVLGIAYLNHLLSHIVRESAPVCASALYDSYLYNITWNGPISDNFQYSIEDSVRKKDNRDVADVMIELSKNETDTINKTLNLLLCFR